LLKVGTKFKEPAYGCDYRHFGSEKFTIMNGAVGDELQRFNEKTVFISSLRGRG